jgi:uncharacterized BrkB/YihY/UPF0761 family membrane protein
LEAFMDLKSLRENKFIDVIVHAVEGFFKYNINALAAETTFYLITLFFPLIMLIFSIISRTPLIDEKFMWDYLGVLPNETIDALYTMIRSVTHTRTMTLTVVLITMWSMSNAISTITRALNKFYYV